MIIPALNEETNIKQSTQSALRSSQTDEVIVVDGGSVDRTVAIAESQGARVRVIQASRGRAHQMNVGAKACAFASSSFLLPATDSRSGLMSLELLTRLLPFSPQASTGDILLFLHADSVLPPNYSALITAALEKPRGSVGWGAFECLAIASRGLPLRLVEAGVRLRTRWAQLPYGDQGLFLTRECFDRLGGYPDVKFMEDYIAVRSLKQFGPPSLARGAVTTDARRWERLGVISTFLTNQVVILGYMLGVGNDTLWEWYHSKSPGPQERADCTRRRT